MRKEIEFTATKGRDAGKMFHIKEMSAPQTEEWAMRVFFAMMNAGLDIPDDVVEMGFAGLVGLGLGALGKIPFDVAKPLLDEMMSCVKAIPDVSNISVIRPLVESDTEEVVTRLQLRKAVFDLHASALKDAAA